MTAIIGAEDHARAPKAGVEVEAHDIAATTVHEDTEIKIDTSKARFVRSFNTNLLTIGLSNGPQDNGFLEK